MNKEELKQYLSNQLSSKEQNAFEKELADNPFFQEAVEGLENFNKDTEMSFDDLDRSLDTKIDEVLTEKSLEVKNVVKMPIFRILVLAASVVGIVFFTLNYLHQQRLSTEVLYEENFKVLTHPDGTVRAGEQEQTTQTETEKAIYFYERENYKQAIAHYELALKSDPNNEKNNLFLAVSYLANYQAEDAIAVLVNSTFASNEYENDRDWYLAMAYLKTKNLKQAIPLFEKLSHIDCYYQSASQKILKSLEDKIL